MAYTTATIKRLPRRCRSVRNKGHNGIAVAMHVWPRQRPSWYPKIFSLSTTYSSERTSPVMCWTNIKEGKVKCYHDRSSSKGNNAWIQAPQRENFPAEIQSLENDKRIDKNSRASILTPYLDENKILRARGRIDAAPNIPHEMKNPIILDRKNLFTKLLVDDYHKRTNHGGENVIMNEIRQKYWIVRMRSTVRSVIYNCQSCKNLRAKPLPPLMGDLPYPRLAHHQRPFTHCGVNYFGPMWVKIGRRAAKRWCVLFTCMCTRAVHLELASTLTTDSAIMAVQRMASRRGYHK